MKKRKERKKESDLVFSRLPIHSPQNSPKTDQGGPTISLALMSGLLVQTWGSLAASTQSNNTLSLPWPKISILAHRLSDHFCRFKRPGLSSYRPLSPRCSGGETSFVHFTLTCSFLLLFSHLSQNWVLLLHISFSIALESFGQDAQCQFNPCSMSRLVENKLEHLINSPA